MVRVRSHKRRIKAQTVTVKQHDRSVAERKSSFERKDYTPVAKAPKKESYSDLMKPTKKPKKEAFIKKGDIFYASWGYDQTNYDYLVVKEVSPSGKTVKCQMTEFKNVGYSGQAYVQKPTSKGFGEVFRMKVESRDGKPQLRGSYPYVQGSRRLGTFYKHDKGKTYHETDSMFGH